MINITLAVSLLSLLICFPHSLLSPYVSFTFLLVSTFFLSVELISFLLHCHLYSTVSVICFSPFFSLHLLPLTCQCLSVSCLSLNLYHTSECFYTTTLPILPPRLFASLYCSILIFLVFLFLFLHVCTSL